MVRKGYHCIYGEVADEEVIQRMNLPKIDLLISTVPEIKDNLLLIKEVRRVNKRAKIITTSSDIEGAFRLYDAGANYVILPHFLGGEHIASMITKINTKKINLKDAKKKHLEHLERRKVEGHIHPES